MTVWPMSGNFASTLVLAAAATGAAIGSGAAANVLTDAGPDSKGPTPAAWSVASAVMTAAIGLAAIHRDPPMITAAVGVCFSSSVAVMTLGLGIVLVVAGRAKKETTTVVSRRAALLLPVALLAFFIGFNGAIRPATAGMLVLEGVAIFPLCVRPVSRSAWRLSSIVQLIVALALVAASGWAAMSAAEGLARGGELFRSGVLPSLVLGPVVALPMIPAVATLAESGFSTAAIDALVMLVLCNLCAVLPLLAFFHPQITIPLLTWRLDTLLLLVVGMLLLPPSIGRWSLGRREGIALIVCFVAYLMITLIATIG